MAQILGTVTEIGDSHITVQDGELSITIAVDRKLMAMASRILEEGNAVYVFGHFRDDGHLEADKMRIIYSPSASVNSYAGYLIEPGHIAAPEANEIEF